MSETTRTLWIICLGMICLPFLLIGSVAGLVWVGLDAGWLRTIKFVEKVFIDG